MTFNPNIFDAYDTNLIIDALEFSMEFQSVPSNEYSDYINQITLIIDKLKGTIHHYISQSGTF